MCSQSLLPLPPEIFLDILSILNQSSDRKKHLSRLCLTSKSLCSLAQPILYSHWESHYRFALNWSTLAGPFLRTILIKKPELASCVKSVVIKPDPHLWVGQCDNSLKQQIIDKVVAAQLDCESDLLNRLGRNSSSAIQAAMLLALPRLETLWFTHVSIDEHVAIRLIVLEPSTGKIRFDLFPTLREVKLQNQGSNFDFNILAKFFHLPSLRRLICGGVGLRIPGPSNHEPGLGFPTRSSNVEAVTLGGRLDESSIKSIVSSCKVLREFSHTQSPGDYRGMNQIDAGAISRALDVHELTLERLYLLWPHHLDLLNTVGSIKRFSTLKELIISSICLTGFPTANEVDAWEEERKHLALAAVLPTSLELLAIVGASNRIRDLLNDLTMSHEDSLPNLKTIELREWQYNNAAREIVQSFSKTSVKVLVSPGTESIYGFNY